MISKSTDIFFKLLTYILRKNQIKCLCTQFYMWEPIQKKKIKKIISIKMSAISIAKIASLKHVKPLSF